MRTTLKGQSGFVESPVLLFSLFLSLVFIYLITDIYGYIATKQNLKRALSETLTIVKAENGYDNSTRIIFDGIAAKLGLKTGAITVSGTPKTVQRGDLVELNANTEYVVKGLKPLDHELTVPIEITVSGLAHTKIR